LHPVCTSIKKLATSIAVLLLAGALSLATTETTPTTPKKAAAKNSAHHPATSTHASRKRRKSSKTSASRKHGQQKIDSERASQIQAALIREHYLTGKPSGNWDAATQQAMQKFQADNGWQSKTTPDSRALIKLGLGPDQQHLLNPESAMTSSPAPTHTAPAEGKTPDPDEPPQPQNQ
jgi:peptidoglycan hydrolase-like protein with peptidoglycan-binding domain